jgi:hypothetical protein
MFDKYKARFKKFEEDHESVHKGIQHVEKNKTVYAAIGGSALTFAGVKAFGRTPELKQILKSNPSISGIAYKSSQVINNTIVQEMVRQGEPGKKTFWVEKGIWFPSRKCAAIASGVSITSVSKICDGVLDSVKGQHFVDGGNMV